MSCDEWLAVIRRNICAAISQKPEYLVWHVAEADTETIFTFDFHYQMTVVLAASADVFNAVADDSCNQCNSAVENLLVARSAPGGCAQGEVFFERIERKNVGIMLDTVI